MSDVRIDNQRGHRTFHHEGGHEVQDEERIASRAQVRAFHDAALRAGGGDNGPPGLRPQCHPSYYGAFVVDLDGYNVEAVCRMRE